MAFRILNTKLEWMPDKEKPASGEVLVLPANDHLWMLSGPGLDLKKQCGKELELDAVRQGPVATGGIVSTAGAGTGFTRLYHAVVMGQDQVYAPGSAESATAAVCDQARRDKAPSMVVYPLYRGVHGKREVIAHEMLASLLAALQEPTTLKTISVLYADPAEKEMLHHTFLRILSGSA